MTSRETLGRSANLKVIERLGDPDTDANADWVEGRADCVLWMDGAVPVNSGTTRSDYSSDAAWLVRRFARNFFEHLTPECDTQTLVAEVQGVLAEEFAGLGQTRANAVVGPPFACFGAARLIGETLELTNAGDCVLLYEDAAGRVVSFGYSAVSALERRATDFLIDFKVRTGASHTDALQATVPAILDNVAQRNRLFGYDVVEPIAGLTTQLERVLMPARSGQRLLAMSDGFFRAVDTYRLLSSEELFETAFRDGLGAILAALRSAEEQDPEARAWPRLKLRDDASAIAFVVET
ncbi:hypothetical protein [Halomonas huangheensis]|uniref:PPM-type phosphatase domain-containing protein n=1 Tax=Halomonas huangheensis TaxID=1178482 RepID=W1NC41_9GAMM|nr:hypothetical protein [Halomonas huangheensis]ALM53021.1 hypothetical protein AR456_12535 [Halomonas huangheensis]ERL53048.1 hypothetical protein BJB45_17375 [Halomonas huangheensis]